jgi:hypothetical protein
MGELVAVAILGAWMWREREQARERRALWERVAGVTLEPPTVEAPTSRRVFGSDVEEWEIEQERLLGSVER